MDGIVSLFFMTAVPYFFAVCLNGWEPFNYHRFQGGKSVNVSEYIFEFLKKEQVKTVFTLTGGGIMYLVEAMGNAGLSYVCCHHEQACSIAAQAYAMYQDTLGVCLVTTGPGGTNALTGAAAAYMDSTPVLFLTGQVKRDDFASKRSVRQFGAQENDIISMAKPVTKYAEVVLEAEKIRYHLEKAVYMAMEGRKGPVWLDIPLDIQNMKVNPDSLEGFTPEEESALKKQSDMKQAGIHTYHLLKEAKRPMILAGQGVLSSGCSEIVEKFAKENGIPVMSTWRTASLFDTEDAIFFGYPGLQAPRYSNILIQGCDLLIVLGSRLDNMITAFSEYHFAFRAKKVIVDIDSAEIDKLNMPEVSPVYGDAREFMQALIEAVEGKELPTYTDWLQKCREVKERFPIVKEEQETEEGVNLYAASEAISQNCRADDVIVISSTSRCNTAGHIAFHHQKGQRTISSMGMGSMGFALPSAVGAYYASNGKRIIMLEGDGSLQLNLQELQTIGAYQIPVKMFIFNNNGYAAITMMQDRNFSGHYVGSNPKSGVTMPNLEKIAAAYGLPYIRINRDEEISEAVKWTMEQEGAVICDISGSLYFDEIPKCISSLNEKNERVSAVLENPYPFLSDEEMEKIYNRLLAD